MKFTFEERINSTVYTDHDFSKNDLFCLLEECSKEYHESRDDIFLFSACSFSGQSKKMEDMISISAHIFDFDGCEVPWQDVSERFSDFYHIVYNSFNNGIKHPEKGSRFRVVVPYHTPLRMPPDMLRMAYEMVWAIFSNILSDIPTGIDSSKRNPNSFFYLPAKTDHPIWHVHDADCLDVMAFLNLPESQAILAKMFQKADNEKPRHIPKQFKSDSEKARIAAKCLEKHASTTPHTGNKSMFSYARSLQCSGFDLMEIQVLLNENYNMFWNPAARKSEIDHIVKNLPKYG